MTAARCGISPAGHTITVRPVYTLLSPRLPASFCAFPPPRNGDLAWRSAIPFFHLSVPAGVARDCDRVGDSTVSLHRRSRAVFTLNRWIARDNDIYGRHGCSRIEQTGYKIEAKNNPTPLINRARDKLSHRIASESCCSVLTVRAADLR